ncbi:MAG: ribosomal protein S18-alanine N-acetyltransferase [Candidatus Latescibacteria bacterium]|nr:ribosomal protein S18-alanine N-acetyltransferase [Candidatus Latescibacterota bacterium]
MTSQDLDQIILIEKQSFKIPWQRSFFEYDLKQNNRYCLVAKENDIVLGYANAWHFADEMQLANIAVKKEQRKQGVGSRLLQEVVNIAQENQCQSIILEVRISNTAAQYMYEKFGFKSIFVRKRYYPDGEEAIVYKKSLKKN